MLLCAEEEREYTPIKTKQAIEYVIEAWKQVKKSTIINCWFDLIWFNNIMYMHKNKKIIICKFNLKNKCKFGEECKFNFNLTKLKRN